MESAVLLRSLPVVPGTKTLVMQQQSTFINQLKKVTLLYVCMCVYMHECVLVSTSQVDPWSLVCRVFSQSSNLGILPPLLWSDRVGSAGAITVSLAAPGITKHTIFL